ncbi:MAG: DUF2238 domain-containing protein [Erysipelotrichaceae bacterium]
MSKQNLKKILNLCVLIYMITLAYAFYDNIIDQDMNGVAMGFVAILCPLIVVVVFKIFHFKPIEEIYIISTAFCYFASLIGSCLGGYSILYFDKVVHLCSGIFATLLALILFSAIKRCKKAKTKEDYHLLIVFINAFNLAVAVFWEFYEYAILIFFNNDAIHHYTQGVHDTITDMLSAFLGGLFITYWVIRHYQSGKENFFTNISEKFYEINLKKEEEKVN